MIYLLLAIFLVSWNLFIFNVRKKKRLDGFYFKGMTSFSFLLIFAYSVYTYMVNQDSGVNLLLFYYPPIRLIIFMGLGLVLGLIGDLFLELQYFYPDNRIKQIRYGMIAFLVGHIFYILGMSFFDSFSYISLIIGAFMVVVVFFASKLMKLDFKEIRIMSYLYTFVIFTMVGQSIILSINNDFNMFSLSFMVGAILFGISDLVLAPIYFGNKVSDIYVVANLGTYYLGQVLIALSVMFL
ncbi:MAG: lysoplasmalogenase family protein [Candidatus Izemoplasmatales bacterium]|jgi:uncharacterized membrane protein YhhN|nr:lysoplasmalogenase family protein [Candidatus Izemoplasmatales bacterium]